MIVLAPLFFNLRNQFLISLMRLLTLLFCLFCLFCLLLAPLLCLLPKLALPRL